LYGLRPAPIILSGLNAFEAILHPAYLCMKIPSEEGPIAVHGSQEAARRTEGSWTDSKAIHNIDGAEACQQYKHKREKSASTDQPMAELPELFRLKCLGPTLEARPHLNGNNPSIPRI
jgi:hypothetical protein